MICPLCSGHGKTPDIQDKKEILRIRKLLAKELRKQGYSIRKIQHTIGYKSPKSIQDILK